jgi:WD40 repeat protein
MKIKTIVTLAVFVSLVSCTLPPTESQIESKNEIIQSKGEIVLLDYAFSPTGDKLALLDNSGVYIYDLSTTQKTSFLEFDNSNYTTIRSGAVAFSPDGKQLAISGKFNETEITIWDIESRKPATTIQYLPKNHFVTEIEFNPNGNSILIRDTNPEVENCQGYISDKVILRSIGKNKNLFEMDKCEIYPPLYFRFTENGRIFLYSGSMSAEHTVYFIESNTGEIISQNVYYWTNDGNHFYDVSPDGNTSLIEKVDNEKRMTYLIDTKSNNEMGSIEGKVAIVYDNNSFVVSGYKPNQQWSFWKDGESKCLYDGITLSPEIKTSANREVFAVMKSDFRLQVWKVSTCEMIGEFRFDK